MAIYRGDARPEHGEDRRLDFRQFRQSLGRKQWLVIGGMAGFILLLHVVGWGVLFGAVAPQELRLGGRARRSGSRWASPRTCWACGTPSTPTTSRPSTTPPASWSPRTRSRSASASGSPSGTPASCSGCACCWRSASRRCPARSTNEDSTLQRFTGVFGTSVSGLFLIALGADQPGLAGRHPAGLVGACADGEYDEQRARAPAGQPRPDEPHPAPGDEGASGSRGTCTRWASCSASASTPRPRSACWCWPGRAPRSSVPWYAILVLPILFAAGMSLLDTIDGLFMNFAYGWAFARPVRKVYYNIVITGLSVAVALVIGIDRDRLDPGRQAVHRLRAAARDRQPRPELRRLHHRRAVRRSPGRSALLWWRFGRVEQRWSEGLLRPKGSPQ